MTRALHESWIKVMQDGEVRLPERPTKEPCAAFHAGVCPVLTGRATANECGCYCGCVLKGATALVADDDSGVRLLNTRVLELVGIGVVPCSDGREAHDTVMSGDCRFDIALLDVTMPGMDGFEVCRALRSRHATVPVVFATGYEGGELGRILDQLGANALIRKPFSLQQLRHVVGGMLCPFMGQYLFGHS